MTAMFVALALVATAPLDPAAHRREIEAWQKERDARLRADGGWLTLAGLFWLKPGANRFGTDPKNEIVLPANDRPAPVGVVPPHAGSFVMDAAGTVTVEMAPGASATMGGKPITKGRIRADSEGGASDVLVMGSLSMQVISRQGRLAVRLKDSQNKARLEWKGLKFYAPEPRYRVASRFVPHERPTSISVPNILGAADSLPSPGYVEFELGGKALRLHPVLEKPGDTQLFFIFKDQTAGKSTYGAGRFLYADLPKQGPVILDFNRAYTPPCAFTPYATCPLPPEQNRLPVPIEAGERFGSHP